MYGVAALAVNSSNVVYTRTGLQLETANLAIAKGPDRRLLSVLAGQRSRIEIRDYPRIQPDSNPNIAPVSAGLSKHASA